MVHNVHMRSISACSDFTDLGSSCVGTMEVDNNNNCCNDNVTTNSVRKTTCLIETVTNNERDSDNDNNNCCNDTVATDFVTTNTCSNKIVTKNKYNSDNDDTIPYSNNTELVDEAASLQFCNSNTADFVNEIQIAQLPCSDHSYSTLNTEVNCAINSQQSNPISLETMSSILGPGASKEQITFPLNSSYIFDISENEFSTLNKQATDKCTRWQDC